MKYALKRLVSVVKSKGRFFKIDVSMLVNRHVDLDDPTCQP